MPVASTLNKAVAAISAQVKKAVNPVTDCAVCTAHVEEIVRLTAQVARSTLLPTVTPADTETLFGFRVETKQRLSSAVARSVCAVRRSDLFA